MIRRRRATVAVLVVVLAAAALGGALVLRSTVAARREAAAPARLLPPLQAADGAIAAIDIQKPVVTVWSDVRNAPDLAGNIDIAADTVRAVGRALQRGVSDDLKGVEIARFEFRAEATNRFDRDVMAKLIRLDMPVADLKAANYAALTRGQLLNLAYSVTLGAPGAYDALDAWCMDPARANPAFCAKARAK
ncbi:MAG: hypothetical protein JWO72_308 [Caulobacteraceae bacterium]|nr:hypothetical protein [Caulobacteraceae bacterium]